MDKGKAKMPDYEDDEFDDNEWNYSLDSEFGVFDVPLMRTPGVQNAIAMAYEKLCYFTREKNRI